MNLRQQLESLSQELAELHDERMDRFDQTLHTIREAYELALNHHAADAIDIARRVTHPLSPSEGRKILAAMIQSLPDDPKALLNISDVTELLSVSPATVAEWIETGQLKASNLSKSQRPRWAIRRADFDRFLEFRAAR
ncbi:MAG: helix-turn-helix domain-containing protein [Planctomycetes bacterium]|nr:helix-turn-helix domain-containing protein [Planctomycetota bacterium]